MSSSRPGRRTSTHRGIPLRESLLFWCSFVSATELLGRYFCNPNFQSQIEAIPGTYTAETDKKYDGINSGEYLVKRLAATY